MQHSNTTAQASNLDGEPNQYLRSIVSALLFLLLLTQLPAEMFAQNMPSLSRITNVNHPGGGATPNFCLSPSGRYCAAQSQTQRNIFFLDPRVPTFVYDLQTKSVINVLLHNYYHEPLFFINDSLLMVAGNGRPVSAPSPDFNSNFLINIFSGEICRSFNIRHNTGNHAASFVFSSDQNYALKSSISINDGAVNIFNNFILDLKSQTTISLPEDTNPLLFLSESTALVQNRLLADTLYEFNLSSGEQTALPPRPNFPKSVIVHSVNSRKEYLLVNHKTQVVYVYDWEQDEILSEYNLRRNDDVSTNRTYSYTYLSKARFLDNPDEFIVIMRRYTHQIDPGITNDNILNMFTCTVEGDSLRPGRKVYALDGREIGNLSALHDYMDGSSLLTITNKGILRTAQNYSSIGYFNIIEYMWNLDPAEARLTFTEDGDKIVAQNSTRDAKTLRTHSELNYEVISSPRWADVWTIGSQEGERVSARESIPIQVWRTYEGTEQQQNLTLSRKISNIENMVFVGFADTIVGRTAADSLLVYPEFNKESKYFIELKDSALINSRLIPVSLSGHLLFEGKNDRLHLFNLADQTLRLSLTFELGDKKQLRVRTSQDRSKLIVYSDIDDNSNSPNGVKTYRTTDFNLSYKAALGTTKREYIDTIFNEVKVIDLAGARVEDSLTIQGAWIADADLSGDHSALYLATYKEYKQLNTANSQSTYLEMQPLQVYDMVSNTIAGSFKLSPQRALHPFVSGLSIDPKGEFVAFTQWTNVAYSQQPNVETRSLSFERIPANLRSFTTDAPPQDSSSIVTPDMQSRIFPTPSVEMVRLVFDADIAGNYAVSLVDLTGIEFFQKTYTINTPMSLELEINTLPLPTGVFFLRLQTPGGSTTHKVLVQP